MTVKRALVSWSGGKDAAWALHRARAEYEIAALVTTVADPGRFVPVHQIPERWIAAQAAALDLPLITVSLPQPCSNAEYAARLRPVWDRAAQEGIEAIVFGDLFLADIRNWREELLSGTAITPVFPLWQQPTRELAQEMLRGGLRATVCAPATLAGRSFDSTFLEELPPDVDPCGENGEFHTFVTRMPGFNREISECAALFR
jgi:uncharacterized protein (TIGR00290 family)